MIKLLIGIIIGIFIIPLIKEVKYGIDYFGIKSIINHPISFIDDVIERTFKGGY